MLFISRVLKHATTIGPEMRCGWVYLISGVKKGRLLNILIITGEININIVISVTSVQIIFPVILISALCVCSVYIPVSVHLTHSQPRTQPPHTHPAATHKHTTRKNTTTVMPTTITSTREFESHTVATRL